MIFPSELNNLPENMEQLIKGYDSLDLAKKLQISTSNKIKVRDIKDMHLVIHYF